MITRDEYERYKKHKQRVDELAGGHVTDAIYVARAADAADAEADKPWAMFAELLRATQEQQEPKP